MDRDERDEFIGKLKRWKCEGCSILVVGEMLDLLRGTSELLLGDDDRNRYRLFVLTDAESASVYDRLSDTSASHFEDRTKILDQGPAPRSVATATTSTTKRVPHVPVVGGLDQLYDEITETFEEFRKRDDRFPAAALRLSVDTLGPLLERYEREDLGCWLSHVGDATKSYHGIGHCLLPKPYDSEAVQQLQRHFDAVIEVEPSEADGATRKERWHVPRQDMTTPWRVIDGDESGMM